MQCFQTKEEKKMMKNTPCTNGIGSILYGMVCSKTDKAYGVSVESPFMKNPN